MSLKEITIALTIMTASQANAEYTTETFSLNYQNMPQYNLNSEFKPSSTMNFSDTEMEYSANKNYYMEETRPACKLKAKMNAIHSETL